MIKELLWSDKTIAFNPLIIKNELQGFAITDGRITCFYSADANYKVLLEQAKVVICFNSYQLGFETLNQHNLQSLYYQVKPAVKFQTLADIVKAEYFTCEEDFQYFANYTGAKQCCIEAVFMREFYIKHYKHSNKKILKLDNNLLKLYSTRKANILVDQTKLRTELSLIQKQQFDLERKLFKKIGYPVIALNQVGFKDRFEGIEKYFGKIKKLKEKFENLIVYFDMSKIKLKFDVTATATGRILCRDENLGLFTPDKELRDIFYTNDKKVFVSADYKRQEAHILATISNDDVLKKDLEDEDFYAKLAQYATKEFDKELGKTLFYAMIYGMTTENLADELDIVTHEAQMFKNRIKKRYDALNYWLIKFDKTENYFGRPLHKPTVNAYVQSTAADIVRDKLNATESYNPVLVLSDNIIYRVHKSNLAEKVDLIKYHLERTDEFNLKVDIKTSNTLQFESTPF